MANKPLILRLLLTGGGTGGHIYPLVTVTKEIRTYCEEKEITLDVRYFGASGPFDTYLTNNGIRVTPIASSKLRRYFSLQNVLDFFKFWIGIGQALWKMFWFMPDVVFSKGGPGALAVILAARFYRVPVVIHESDAVASLTTRHSAKHAAVVELAFEQAKQNIKTSAPINVVGGLVRDAVFIDESPATSRLALGLTDQLPTLLIVGGSQGAQKLNELMLENAEAILREYEIIHQVGRDNYLDYKAEFEFVTKNLPVELRKNYRMYAYLDDKTLSTAYNAADLVICRSGSMLSELSALGKPAILVPLPTAANDHQRENAYAYADTGAAIVIEEENFLVHILLTQLKKLFSDPQKLERMGQAARTFYRADASERIAEDILEVSSIIKYYANQLEAV